MNWNPYRRPDYKNMTDAQLGEAAKGFQKKGLVCLGINVVALVIACVAVAAIFLPAVPAIPVYISNFMIAGSLFSSNRFSRLGRECRTEQLERTMARLNNQTPGFGLMEPEAVPPPAPAPAPAPDFNSAAATVLDDDLEISRPLQFKKKAPGATA